MIDSMKEFPITSICKEDILQAYEGTDLTEQTKKRVEAMDDSDMRELASKMADAYMNVFWDDLRIIFEERFLIEEETQRTIK